jgi:hypothetical protein
VGFGITPVPLVAGGARRRRGGAGAGEQARGTFDWAHEGSDWGAVGTGEVPGDGRRRQRRRRRCGSGSDAMRGGAKPCVRVGVRVMPRVELR